MESQSFVLHTAAVITQSGIDKMEISTGSIMSTVGGGFSAVFGPDGRRLSEPIPSTEEGIVYADIDLDDILKARAFLDVCGHYSRPDLLWLGVDSTAKSHARDHQAAVVNLGPVSRTGRSENEAKETKPE